MQNSEKSTMVEKNIKVSDIYPQRTIPNRSEAEVTTSISFVELQASIESTGLIHPVTVREDMHGRYELFVGYRRYLACKELMMAEGERFEMIRANVWSADTPDEVMLKKLIHENKVRSNIKSIERLEQEIALIPVYLNCAEKDNLNENIRRGFVILREYKKFTQNINMVAHMDKIIQMTKCEDAMEKLDAFFDDIQEKPASFFDKALEIIEAPKEVKKLLYRRTITIRQAKDLRTLKSDEDRQEIITRLETEHMKRKEFDALIQESRFKNNLNEQTREILRFLKRITGYLKQNEVNLTDEQYTLAKNSMVYLETFCEPKKLKTSK